MALFKTFGMQHGDIVIFFSEIFQKSKILKNAVSGRWCIDSGSFTIGEIEFNIHCKYIMLSM